MSGPETDEWLPGDPLTAREIAAATDTLALLDHRVTYTYPAPVSRLEHRLVVLPRRSHAGQDRLAHRFHVLVDGRNEPSGTVARQRDAWGNSRFVVHVEAAAEQVSFATRALVARTHRRAPIGWYADPADAVTELTRPDPDLEAAAAQLPRRAPIPERAREAMSVVHRRVRYTPGATTVQTPAAQAFASGHGVCQDMAHVLLAICHAAGIPARYVSGHLVGEGASHAWVEVHDADTGSVVALDPTHDRVTDLRYLTVAVGRDYADVAPTRGTVQARPGGGGRLTIEKRLRMVSTRNIPVM